MPVHVTVQLFQNRMSWAYQSIALQIQSGFHLFVSRYYLSSEADCFQFPWGGCAGNDNRFLTKSQVILSPHLSIYSKYAPLILSYSLSAWPRVMLRTCPLSSDTWRQGPGRHVPNLNTARTTSLITRDVTRPRRRDHAMTGSQDSTLTGMCAKCRLSD